ncbi:MAG: sulfatase-like hydrolase/transferase, partial [Planctomycetota bacterium]
YHQAEPRAAYAAMVAFLDGAVGRVLDALEEQGIAESTVVFFASDNGSHFEGGAHPDTFESNAPLRGGKRDLYEGGIRTPQIVWWPGTIEAGAVSDHVTAFWDFPATALDLAGADVPVSMDGVSIAPTLVGRPADQRTHDYLYWEFHEHGGKQAVLLGRYKGVRLNVGDRPDGPIELYDLEHDLGETMDIAADHPEVVAEVERVMLEAHIPSPRFRFGSPR